jgi:hypothetical protein
VELSPYAELKGRCLIQMVCTLWNVVIDEENNQQNALIVSLINLLIYNLNKFK